MKYWNKLDSDVRFLSKVVLCVAALTPVISGSLVTASRTMTPGQALWLGGIGAAVMVACGVLSLGVGEWIGGSTKATA